MGPVVAKDKRDSHSARFGDLAITVTAMESTEAETHRGDRHFVAVFVTVKNAGNSAVCMEFMTRLKTTYGLTYSGNSSVSAMRRFPAAPKIRDMLPGEESSGSYAFLVKDGVQPLEMTLVHP
jgi:hypothetical protein